MHAMVVWWLFFVWFVEYTYVATIMMYVNTVLAAWYCEIISFSAFQFLRVSSV